MDSIPEPASKRNWGAEVATWVVIIVLLHPLSLGSVAYLEGRGWVIPPALERVLKAFYAPEVALLGVDPAHPNGIVKGYIDYLYWWRELGMSHAPAPVVATPVSPASP